MSWTVPRPPSDGLPSDGLVAAGLAVLGVGLAADDGLAVLGVGPAARDWVATSRRLDATAEAKSANRSTVSGRTDRSKAMP